MIPQRLRLHNFLSYRDCELDFRNLHLATLAGRNGDGKSALLDAITWALWGQARGRVEDDRIYYGEHEMRVELDFEVDGDHYRVIRKRTRGRSGALDFFQIDDSGGLRPITGGTSRETQAELVRRVHLDHTTFINSVYLLQGRANEFTTKSAGDRKEVLRKVLGLDRYEELSRQAHERRRAAASDAAAEERLIGDDEERLAEAPAVAEALAGVVREREDARGRLEEQEQEAGELRIAAAERKRREEALGEAEAGLEAREQALSRREKSILTLESELAAVRETLAHGDDIEKAYGELRAAREEERALADLAAQARRQEDAVTAAEAAIERERAELETRLAAVDQQRERAVALAAGLPALREERTAIDGEQARLDQLIIDMERERDAAAADQRIQAGGEAEARGYHDRASELKERETALAKAEGEPLCPVCRKPLTPEELRDTVEQYRRERHELGERYKATQEAAKEAKDSANRHRRRAADLDRERAELDARLRSREQALAANLAEAQRAESALPELDREIDALRAPLADESFAAEARERRSAAQAQLAALGYEREAHARLRERLAELEPAESAFTDLARSREQEQGLITRIAETHDERRRDEAARDGARAALTEARDALDASQDVSGRLDGVEAAVAAHRERLTALDQEHGRLEERRATLDRLAASVEEARDRLAAHRDSALLHEELAKALGRDGVQAMLIEQSLPELERIANALLDQLTEGRGRTQVALATQRESASGKTVETLDIHISDDLGTRDYEMYSGGEKFRVDFALRLALSRLLAMRSGASLPTLIIDEGFGTQDEEGRDRLVAAINAISSEFRLILLVTHIEELRESFGRRIQVTKDPERGSTAVVE